MTDADLIAAFVAWRVDIDSEPFAHEAEWEWLRGGEAR